MPDPSNTSAARPAPSAESQTLTVVAAELVRRQWTADEKPVTDAELVAWGMRVKAIADAIR